MEYGSALLEEIDSLTGSERGEYEPEFTELNDVYETSIRYIAYREYDILEYYLINKAAELIEQYGEAQAMHLIESALNNISVSSILDDTDRTALDTIKTHIYL